MEFLSECVDHFQPWCIWFSIPISKHLKHFNVCSRLGNQIYLFFIFACLFVYMNLVSVVIVLLWMWNSTFLTFLTFLMFVNIWCTRHVLENIAPKPMVKPRDNRQKRVCRTSWYLLILNTYCYSSSRGQTLGYLRPLAVGTYRPFHGADLAKFDMYNVST